MSYQKPEVIVLGEASRLVESSGKTTQDDLGIPCDSDLDD